MGAVPDGGEVGWQGASGLVSQAATSTRHFRDWPARHGMVGQGSVGISRHQNISQPLVLDKRPEATNNSWRLMSFTGENLIGFLGAPGRKAAC